MLLNYEIATQGQLTVSLRLSNCFVLQAMVFSYKVELFLCRVFDLYSFSSSINTVSQCCGIVRSVCQFEVHLVIFSRTDNEVSGHFGSSFSIEWRLFGR